MNEITIIYIAVGVLYVICFFVLCYNVGKIKKHLCSTTYNYNLLNYYKHLSFGNYPKAKECLINHVWNIGYEIQLGRLGAREQHWKNLEEKYGPLFEKLGEKWPELLPLDNDGKPLL